LEVYNLSYLKGGFYSINKGGGNATVGADKVVGNMEGGGGRVGNADRFLLKEEGQIFDRREENLGVGCRKSEGKIEDAKDSKGSL